MAAREDVGQLSPAGEVLETPVGAVPRGPSPPGQTAPLSKEAWVEVGREDCTGSASLPATLWSFGVLASVGLPIGGPQSQPVPFPAWDSEALEWVKAGASAVVQVEQRRKRKRGRSSA